MSKYGPSNIIHDKAVESIGTLKQHKFYKNILVPSTMNQYSVAIEFMRNWFLEKFPKNYFKTVNIDGSHISEDYMKMDPIQRTKRLKPMLSIIPKINLEFDDSVSTKRPWRFVINQSFFRDAERCIYLRATPELLEMPFEFKIMVSSKANQIDLYRKMNILFPITETETPYMDLDIHVPYELVEAIGSDIGFKFKNDGSLEDPDSFIEYMNKHSYYVFLPKFRGITNRKEIFLRWPTINGHIKIESTMDYDDGEKVGSLYDNFSISMNVMLHFPAIRYFEYSSCVKHDYIVTEKDASEYLGMFSIPLLKIPELNDKGWGQYVVTDYEDIDAVGKQLTIPFADLFRGDDIQYLIGYTKSIFIHPTIFMDIHIYNHDKEMHYNMDWDTLCLTTVEPVTAYKSYIVIYTDFGYMNDTMLVLKDMDKSRYKII